MGFSVIDSSIIDSYHYHFTGKRIVNNLRKSQAEGYGFLELSNCFVRYRIAGNGPTTLVFPTDPPVMIESYDEIIRALAPHYKVIVFELPGFGYSFPKKNMRFDFDPAVQTLLTCLDAWDSAPYGLVFSCASVFFARKMAELSPETITHLTLLQCPSWAQEQAWVDGLDPRGILSTGIVGQLFLTGMKKKIARDWVNFASHSKGLSKQLIETSESVLGNGGCYCLASAIQRTLRQEEPHFNKIKQPILSLYGECDRSHSRTDFHTIKEHCSHAIVKPIPNVGHFPELENTPLFTDYLKSFMSGSLLA